MLPSIPSQVNAVAATHLINHWVCCWTWEYYPVGGGRGSGESYFGYGHLVIWHYKMFFSKEKIVDCFVLITCYFNIMFGVWPYQYLYTDGFNAVHSECFAWSSSWQLNVVLHLVKELTKQKTSSSVRNMVDFWGICILRWFSSFINTKMYKWLRKKITFYILFSCRWRYGLYSYKVIQRKWIL